MAIIETHRKQAGRDHLAFEYTVGVGSDPDVIRRARDLGVTRILVGVTPTGSASRPTPSSSSSAGSPRTSSPWSEAPDSSGRRTLGYGAQRPSVAPDRRDRSCSTIAQGGMPVSEATHDYSKFDKVLAVQDDGSSP